MTASIEVRGLVKRFGGLTALAGVDLEAHPGEVLGIIGVNGAGKTTLMNCICGIYRPDEGRVLIGGRDTTGLTPHEVASLGIGRTFQIPRVFRRMSLIDNLLVPVLRHPDPDSALIERAEAMLERMRLIDPQTLENQLTLDDPVAFTKPWTVTRTFRRAKPGDEMREFVCMENNRNPIKPDGSVGVILQGNEPK